MIEMLFKMFKRYINQQNNNQNISDITNPEAPTNNQIATLAQFTNENEQEL